MHRLRFFQLLLILAAASAFAQNSKRPLSHRDYDTWRTIFNHALTTDGKYLAYGLFPEQGDGDLVIKNVATGKEFRENIGAMPPPPPRTDDESPVERQPAGRGIRIV